MSARRAFATLGALGLFVGCTEPSASAARVPSTEPAPEQAPPAPPASTSAGDERLRVPELVAKLHRNAFDPRRVEAVLGPVLCFVTLHDAAFGRGELYPLVLFASGSVATWRQTASGSEEQFYAKLSADEIARAAELVEAIPKGSSLARATFEASGLVMGVSTRVGERVETLYFDNARLPSALGQLVGLLKHRLEATNRGL